MSELLYLRAANLVLWKSVRESDFKLAWYIVAAIVLFALGVTITLGAIAFCTSKGMYFGAVQTINIWSYRVGCFRWAK
ncbi:MAG: hypothetical protein Q4D79_14920 [Propionibacteriaceae bacterium]|nr:hypothetical protein [Propionibacteriaceae bacterium]